MILDNWRTNNEKDLNDPWSSKCLLLAIIPYQRTPISYRLFSSTTLGSALLINELVDRIKDDLVDEIVNGIVDMLVDEIVDEILYLLTGCQAYCIHITPGYLQVDLRYWSYTPLTPTEKRYGNRRH